MNPLKIGVGTVNVLLGAAGVASGAVILAAGTATTPVFGIGAPAVAVGTGKIALGLSNVSRGSQQFGEGLRGGAGSSAKNLLGLLPFGQEYDDPAEPGPIDYAKGRYREFVRDPAEAGKRLLKDFFAVDGGTR